MNLNTVVGMEEAKLWTQRFINQIKDGGIWMVPRSCSTYQIWHSSKEFKCLNLGEDCIHRVLNALGYAERSEA